MNEIFTRRSCRAYTSEAVEEDKLAKILEAANYAPSAMNNQDRQFTAIVNRDILVRLNAAVENAVSPEAVERIKGRLGGVFSFFYNAPVLIVTSHFDDALEPASDCACALQNIFLEATSLGLGSCWINQLSSLCDDPAVRAVLTEAGIPCDQKIFGCAAIGYPATEGKLFKAKESKIVVCK